MDSTSNLDLMAASQGAKEAVANDLFAAVWGATFFARRASTTAGLTWGYYGARMLGATAANGTVALTANSTNYVVVNRSTLAVSVSTSNTNWNDTATYGRAFLITAGASAVTDYQDWRWDTGGINVIDSAAPTGSAGGDLAGTYPNPTVDANKITLAKMATVATASILGRTTAGTGNVEALTATQAKGVLAIATGDVSGLGTAAVLASTALIHADGSIAFSADQSLGSHKLTNVTDPSSAQDAATKAYVDALAVNLGKRARVRAATTANITIATALNNADTLDGVTLATGDLVLVKDQSAPADNGVYVVGVSPARDAQFDTYNEHPGSLLAVEEGTTNADTLWLCTSNDGGTLSSTAIAFTALNISAAITQLTSDVTAGPGSGSQPATIAANAVTLAKMATVATARFLGRTTAGTGNVEALTETQATAMLDAVVGDSGSGGTKGLAPAPGAGDAAAGKFLKADGTYAVPSGGAPSGSAGGDLAGSYPNPTVKASVSLTTPNINVATATSVNKVAITAPATSATLAIADGKTLTASNSLTLAGTDATTMTFPPASASIGYINIPQNSQSTAYTTVLADAGKHLLHPAADTSARTFTIDSNANVAYPIGTAITFVNEHSAGVMTIAITSDTMRLAGAGTTGSRTLAADGIATALKITSTSWIISGTGLT